MSLEINSENNTNNLVPNIAQENALLSISKMKQENKNKYLVVLPSGIGKTYLSAFETYDFHGNILYIAHRGEILNQAKEVFKKIHLINEEDIGFYKDRKKQIDKKIIFASIQTLSRIKNLEKIPREHFDYIIFDEWHHVGALTYKKVLEYFRPKYLLGMTATPYRLDRKDILSSVNYNIPYQMEIEEGIGSGLLVPFEYFGIWDDVDYSDIKWCGYRYTKNDLDKKLLIDKRDKAVIDEVKKHIEKRQAIGFCNSIKHANRCVKKFNERGFSTNMITCETDLDKRREIVEDFRNKKYQIIFTRDIFNEGVDFPDVECLLFLRPTFSKTVFFQQLGRGLRKKKGKENVIVLDFIGNYINAYKIKNWLNEIIEKSVEKRRNWKPEYDYRLPTVHFDARIIDLFNMQEKGSGYTKEYLMDFYLKLKETLGRIPTSHDIDKSSVSRFPFCTRWGSWQNFKLFMQDDQRFMTRERIKHKFIEFYNKNGFIPSYNEITKNNLPSVGTVSRIFGCTYNEAVTEMGLKQESKESIMPITKEQITNQYKNFYKKHGHTPQSKIIRKYNLFSEYTVRRVFGCRFSEALIEMGIPPKNLGHFKMTKKQITNQYKDFYKKHGDIPSIFALNKNKLVSSTTVCKVFGCSFNEALIEMGINVIKFHHITRETVIKDYFDTKKKLGNIPRMNEIHSRYTWDYFCAKYFGSYRNFLYEIEFKKLYNKKNKEEK